MRTQIDPLDVIVDRTEAIFAGLPNGADTFIDSRRLDERQYWRHQALLKVGGSGLLLATIYAGPTEWDGGYRFSQSMPWGTANFDAVQECNIPDKGAPTDWLSMPNGTPTTPKREISRRQQRALGDMLRTATVLPVPDIWWHRYGR